MTSDDIIRMAKEAGGDDWGIFRDFMPEIERFAELVAAEVMPKEALAEMFEWGKDAGRREEREACLSIAKSQIDNCFTLLSHPPKSSAAYKIQIAIEARSKPQPETLSPAELRRRTNAPWNDKASY
jgi:hypothetical protein